MAIYKLGEIGELKYSKSFVANGNDSDFPIFATGGIVGYTKIPTFESNSIILPRVGTMSIYFTNKKHSTKNTAFSFKTKDDTTTKYIYYLMSSIDFSIFSIGSAVPRLTSNFWNQYFINLPPLEEQQKIIDIIEPLETISTKIKTTKKAIISLLKMIANHKIEKTNELLINHLTFEKGKNGPKEFESSGTPFLDIRTLNTRISSKFVKDQPNTFKGDILLSLDATVGLVDWFIEGFNGYLYNLKSDYLTKVEILLNVLNNTNKKIIEMNATGSTIKHASKAKKEMLYFKLNSEWKNITNTLFKLLLLIEEIEAKKTKLYQLCVNLLIR
ncbi:hypothetical protein LD125_00468 [Mesoplasma sp. JKS002658]|uniref:restriction endonuclease subunit S n=1 Tax=Mesoplasma whartonense TaxID=2878854 RepID=UPI002022A4E9|nr:MULTISPECIES: restriction endonuclease subunit S [unclassified Mesoplasma]MCL8212266.1 hypothetical protein [Mesoplasma sp. JKS002662]MCL8214205.1 hypothetical protein [Mesoplasma sp. JKS002658]